MTAKGAASRNQLPEHGIRGMSLVRVSLLLAIWLEVIPFEINIISALLSLGAVSVVLAVKAVCLTAILLPLLIYVLGNGLSALKHVKGRAAVIGVIVVIHLVVTISIVLTNLKGRWVPLPAPAEESQPENGGEALGRIRVTLQVSRLATGVPRGRKGNRRAY